MNENNVKIKITEVNNTSPAGIPTDSTDIAFIPGFAKAGTADWAPTLNTPVLCTTVEEFESYFGTTPYILTAGNLADYGDLGFTEGDPDRSYIFAKELLYAGMSVVYVAMSEDGYGSPLDMFYAEKLETLKHVKDFYELIQDKGSYSVKYITSGGYPSVIKSGDQFVSKFAGDMLSCAAVRGDAVALVDYQMDKDLPTTGTNSFYSKISGMAFENTDFGALMYPWAHYNLVNTSQDDITMPASYAYLSCMARAIKASPNWLAMAGVSRGLVKGIKSLCTVNGIVSNKDAEDMQPKKGTSGNQLSVNCITDIKPYGLCFWGNRTMRLVNGGGCDALNFLNTRNMLNDIKKLLFSTARYLMFEQNSDSLWLRFKAGVSPLLNQLKQGNGISDFKIIKSKVNHKGEKLDKGELAAVIRIYPIHAVEYFDLTVEINDEDVTVE